MEVTTTTFYTSTPLEGVACAISSTTNVVVTPTDAGPADFSARCTPPVPIVERNTVLPFRRLPQQSAPTDRPPECNAPGPSTSTIQVHHPVPAARPPVPAPRTNIPGPSRALLALPAPGPSGVAGQGQPVPAPRTRLPGPPPANQAGRVLLALPAPPVPAHPIPDFNWTYIEEALARYIHFNSFYPIK